MSIIRFTPADALQTRVIEAGVYPCQVTKIEGPKASKSGKSNSYFVDFQVTEGKYKGKEKTIVFNTETSSPSLLGDMKFFPVGYLLQVDAAANGRDIEAVDYELDTDNLLFHPLDVQWIVVTVEGALANDIVGFLPPGAGANAPSF